MRSLRSQLGAALLLCAASNTASAQSICIKNARIYPVSGPVIERGMVVVQGGKIAAIGVNVPVPSDARVIDAAGKVVVPGIVDANARFAMAVDNEQSSEVTPEARAIHLFDPFSRDAKRALIGGVTTACLSPGSLNVIGGLCSVVKTTNGNRGSTMRDAVALRAALGSDVSANNQGFRGAGGDTLASIYARRPNSRMAAVWELRYALFRAAKSASLARVVKGDLPLRIHARVENDIRAAITVAEEFKLRRVILDNCVEAYKIADLIAEHKFPVVLGPFFDVQTDNPEGSDGCLNTAGLLAEKGVKVSFGSNGADPANLLVWAALAARAGLSQENALKAITLHAAEVSGVGDRVGSLQPGKDGDLLILSGEPLDVTSRIEMVIVNGQVAYDAK